MKSLRVVGSLVLPLVVVLSAGLMFVFSSSALAQSSTWPALPQYVPPSQGGTGDNSGAKPGSKPSVEAPVSPVVTTTPSVVTPTPSPSKKDADVKKAKKDKKEKNAKKDKKVKKAKKGKGHVIARGKGHHVKHRD